MRFLGDFGSFVSLCSAGADASFSLTFFVLALFLG
jgi:hypothetical protein